MVIFNDKAKDESCQIVPTEGAMPLESNPVASLGNVELERTPGAVAVSEVRGEGSEGGNSFSDTSLTNSFPLTGQTGVKITRLVGYKKLKALLQPVHSYFTDKFAWITHFNLYSDESRELVYPVVKAEHKNNPYRRQRLSHKASQRTFKRIRQFAENNKWQDFMVAGVVTTMPKFMSEYLAGQGDKGRDMAWRLFEGYWSEDWPAVVGQDIELGSHTNLHLWRTAVPTEAHFHFHSLIPNYGLVVSKEIDEDGKAALEFKRWAWFRQRGGALVPFSNAQLEKLKELWRLRLERFCKRHGIEFKVQQIDIFVEYIDDWGKLLHRLNYNGRHWSENYAEYSNEHPDCPDPPEWLEGYENRARCKGWWSNLKQLTVGDTEKEKISPYTGEPMTFVQKIGLQPLVEDRTLGYVEFVKGKPFEGGFTKIDIKWLEGVMDYNQSFVSS